MSRSPRSPFTALAARAGVLAVGLATWVGGARPAQAFEEYPAAIQEAFPSATCPVTCLLCHSSMAGGKDTVRPAPDVELGGARGYGVFVQNLIAIAGDAMTPITSAGTISVETMKAAVLALQSAPCDGASGPPCDSDGDGATDFAELGAGTDPSKAGGGSDCPQYGCGARVAPATAPVRGPDAGAIAAALGVALVLARRFRRKSSS